MKQISTPIALVWTFIVSMLCVTMEAQAEADKQVQYTIPSTGILAFQPERNFYGPAGLVVSSFFSSSNATSKGLKFTNKELGEGIIIAHQAGGSSALILTGKPGTYTLTYTDEAATTQFNTTSALWTTENKVSTTKTDNRIYKFINTAERVGFVRDETYAADKYNACDFGEGEHLYTNLPKTALERIVSTMSTTIDELSFIPWSTEWWGCPEIKPQPTEVTFDFSSESFRENIGTAMGDTKGFIYNETFAADNVTLQITGGSAPSRIYTDASRGQCLVTYKEYTTLTFKAPAGYAITQIVFTAAGNSNIKNFTASSGAIEGMVWTGNAEGVRFTQGGTSYLANAIVTLAAKTGETTVLPAIDYKECANIAAFNALSGGEYAKVTLTDAEVIGKSADGYSTVWIQDATGGCWIQYTSLNDKLQEKTKVNGFVYVAARPNSGNVQMKEAEATLQSEITSSEISDYTIVEGTIAEVNIDANKNKVVKITGATLEETSATAGKLTQGEVTINVNNGNATANQQLHKIAEWAKDTKLENVTVVAILVGSSATANQLLPISITTGGSGIANVNAANADKVVIYNLQGVRLKQLQRGLNIVNGQKVVIK